MRGGLTLVVLGLTEGVRAVAIGGLTGDDPCLSPLRQLTTSMNGTALTIAERARLSELCTVAHEPLPARASVDDALLGGNLTRSVSFLQLELQEEQADWSALITSGTPPSPRGGHCAHLVLSTLYIYGGCAAGPRVRCHNDVHALDIERSFWSRVPTSGSAPHPASQVACASNGPTLAVFGGYAGSYSSAVHLFDATTHTWRLATPAGAPPKPRQGATLTRFAGGFVLFGGSDDVAPYNDVHILSTSANEWRKPNARCAPQPCALPAPREGHSATLTGNKLWIFGGVGKVGRSYVSLTSLAYLDVTTNTWHDPTEQMQLTNLAPSGRSLQAALTLGSRFLVLGGITTPTRTPLGDVAILDGETFTWSRPLPTGHPPAARSGASATLRGRRIHLRRLRCRRVHGRAADARVQVRAAAGGAAGCWGWRGDGGRGGCSQCPSGMRRKLLGARQMLGGPLSVRSRVRGLRLLPPRPV